MVLILRKGEREGEFISWASLACKAGEWDRFGCLTSEGCGFNSGVLWLLLTIIYLASIIPPRLHVTAYLEVIDDLRMLRILNMSLNQSHKEFFVNQTIGSLQKTVQGLVWLT